MSFGRETPGSPALPADLPDDLVPEACAPRGEPSLMGDVEALIADGKTYLEAELTFQKTRAGFTADRLKWVAVYGAGAFALLHLALIGLTVGVIIALTALVGPWIATGIVVVLLLAGALLFVQRLRSKLSEISSVFEDPTP